jgi:hypothetical protein
MRVNSGALKQDLRKSIVELKKLGKEIRGDLRAAGADARKQWESLIEPQLANVEKLAKDIGEVSQQAVARTASAFTAFHASIKAPKKGAPRRRPAARASKRAN